mgnify:CR=1 FL=1
MAKEKKVKEKKVLEGLAKFNRVSKPVNFIFSIIFIIAALCCVIPLIFVIIISFTDKTSIAAIGYSLSSVLATSLVPFSKYLFNTVFITVVGTVLGLFLNATIGYVLSRRSFKFRKLYTWLVFIPMIFNGGMVSTYIVYTQLLGLRDNILVLILPLAVSSFNVIILRTFFQTTVPDSLIESGKIDGASQLRIFFQIVLPISLPALATVGLFLCFGYWNDWWNAFMYINEQALYPLQFVLINIEKTMDFFTNSAAYMGMAAYEVQQRLPQDGMRMALVVVIVLPIACAYPFFQKYFVSGLTIGAVKG